MKAALGRAMLPQEPEVSYQVLILGPPFDQHAGAGADRQRVRLHVQHDPAGELLVHRLLGVARP